MSTNQLHGKTFETEVITTCFGLTEEHVKSISSTAVFDIPFGVTTCLHPSGDPVSIKTAAVKAAKRAASICLSDARRVWAWDGPLIVVVGLYAQVAEKKVFHTVYECHLRLDAKQRVALHGDLTLSEVAGFHEHLKSFGLGLHVEARNWAKQRKKELSARTGAIQLNPKIDSKMQRRLQCSIKLEHLLAACPETMSFTQTDTGDYRGLALPFSVQSSARQFSSADNQS